MNNEQKSAQNQNPETEPKPAPEAVTIPDTKTNTPFMPQKTLVLIGVLSVVTIILLGLALYTGFPQASRPTAQKPVKVLQTTLSVLRPVASSSTNAYVAEVALTTEREKVTAVEIDLTYDPKILTNVDIKPGTFFSNPTILRETIDKTNGKVSFVLGIGLGQSPVNGNGTVAVLSFTTLPKSGITTISFLKQSAVTVSTVRPSILTNAQGIQFSFGPTPTP